VRSEKARRCKKNGAFPMDYYESIVVNYLRADRALFVNTECCVQLNQSDNPDGSGPHWYCDATLGYHLRRHDTHHASADFETYPHTVRLRAALRRAYGYVGGRVIQGKGIGWLSQHYGWNYALWALLGCISLAIILLAFTWNVRPRA